MFKSLNQIEELVDLFQNKTLPKSEWTHHAHLSVALWHVYSFEFDDAVCRIKSGIMNYNLHVGNENTSSGGYHESITLFWMDTIKLFIESKREANLLELINSFLASPNAEKTYPFEFYTKETLMSSLARARYIAPDKAPLQKN